MYSQIREFIIADPGGTLGEPPRHRVLEALSQRGATLHELEYEDLALTTRGLRLVRHAAMDVLRRFFSVEAADVPPARALALFLDRVFWDEQTGGLLLCADFPGQSFCLPLPRDLWGLRVRAGYSQ